MLSPETEADRSHMINDAAISVKPGNGKPQILHICRQIEQLANTFLERLLVRGLSENTATAYAYDLLSLFRWLQAVEKTIFTCSRDDLFEYIKAQTERGSMPRSINRRLVVCDLFLQFLTERSLSIHGSHLAHLRQNNNFCFL